MIDEKIEQLNNVDRFILLLLGARNFEAVPGSIHLQKEMYLLRNLFPELADETDYEPHMLGPYSEIVADETGELKSSDLIKSDSERLELALDGRHAFGVLKKRSSEMEFEKIEEFKGFLNDLTEDEVLAFTYFSYPSQDGLERESARYESISSRRRDLAVSMYQKGKISAQKAAQIAGDDFEDFFQELKMRLG